MLRERAYRKQEMVSATTISNIQEKELKYQLTSNNNYELRVLQRLGVEEPLDSLQEDVEGEGIQETGDSHRSNYTSNIQEKELKYCISTDLQQ
jgi:hypothetical protein